MLGILVKICKQLPLYRLFLNTSGYVSRYTMLFKLLKKYKFEGKYNIILNFGLWVFRYTYIYLSTFDISLFFHLKGIMIHKVGSQVHQYIVSGLETNRAEVRTLFRLPMYTVHKLTNANVFIIYWVWLITFMFIGNQILLK